MKCSDPRANASFTFIPPRSYSLLPCSLCSLRRTMAGAPLLALLLSVFWRPVDAAVPAVLPANSPALGHVWWSHPSYSSIVKCGGNGACLCRLDVPALQLLPHFTALAVFSATSTVPSASPAGPFCAAASTIAMYTKPPSMVASFDDGRRQAPGVWSRFHSLPRSQSKGRSCNFSRFAALLPSRAHAVVA